MDQFLINMLNGLSSGLLLFMLSSGLTLIFSMMGVLNFAHASFYMVGAYIGYTLTRAVGFWPALVIAPLAVGLLGALFERSSLRRVHKFGHVPELLITFGLSYVVLEIVQIVWGRTPVQFDPPAVLQGPAFTLIQSPSSGFSIVAGAAADALCQGATKCSRFPLTRAFMMAVALGMLVSLWLLLTRTRIGLVIQAALTHPEMAEALGHNVPRVFMLVFGSGCALAGLAGVIGGNYLTTESSMADAMGPIVFVVVVFGGLGSLGGCFIASIIMGMIQTFAVVFDYTLADIVKPIFVIPTMDNLLGEVLTVPMSRIGPLLPYALMILILLVRPRGLLGTRDT